MTKVSMAGGLEFFVDGKGLDDMPSINQVQYTTTQGAQPVTMIGQPLDSKCFFEFEITLAPKRCLTDFFYFLVDDQIQSATTLGKLAYKMPAIADFFGVDDFTKAINTAYIGNSKDENLKF